MFTFKLIVTTICRVLRAQPLKTVSNWFRSQTKQFSLNNVIVTSSRLRPSWWRTAEHKQRHWRRTCSTTRGRWVFGARRFWVARLEWITGFRSRFHHSLHFGPIGFVDTAHVQALAQLPLRDESPCQGEKGAKTTKGFRSRTSHWCWTDLGTSAVDLASSRVTFFVIHLIVQCDALFVFTAEWKSVPESLEW